MPDKHIRTESAAAIMRHPLHPFLVAFPIAFLIGGFLADLMFWHSGDAFWLRASVWLLGAGLATGVLAAATGLIDFLSISRARSLTAGWVHLLGNAIALIITAANLWLRFQTPPIAVVPAGVSLSGLVVLLLAVTGWLGGELVFRHHIGMVGQDAETVRRH